MFDSQLFEMAKTLEERYRLANFYIPTKMLFDAQPGVGVMVTIRLHVLDRDSGSLATVRFSEVISHRELAMGFEYLDHAVRSRLTKVLLHELDECFLVDGRRKFDPHLSGP